VIIDGLDGSGKSTQANLLLKKLKKQHKTVCLRIHPETDNWFGRKARAFLFAKGKSAHFASALSTCLMSSGQFCCFPGDELIMSSW